MKRLPRLALAALVGALAMFIWGAVSHMVLLKGVGFTRMPHDEWVLAELRKSLSKDGLYFFPSVDLSGHATAEETSAWAARFRAGPTGMIVFHPSGDEPVSPTKLALQFLSDLFAAAIGAFVVSLIAAPNWRRSLVLGLLGAFSCLSVAALYWNWYGFPTAFFLAQCVDKVVGWSIAGVLIARIAPLPTAPSWGQSAGSGCGWVGSSNESISSST
jgi:hypothetical protein